MKKVMTEFKEGKLHSGSKKGPEVTNPKQAVAIAYSEAKRAKKHREEKDVKRDDKREEMHKKHKEHKKKHVPKKKAHK